MKKTLFFSLMLLVMSTFAYSQKTSPSVTKTMEPTIQATVPVTTDPAAPQEPPSKAKLTFVNGENDFLLDYGTVEMNAEPLRIVKFTNTGTEPLIIKNARGSCGCTVPTWPKEPIMPGETGQIEVRYATNRVGPINKKVTITTNEAVEHFINLAGKVNDTAKTPDPVPAPEQNVIKGGN